MTIVDAYFFLFFDSFVSMLIMLPNSHMAFKVMLEFDGYSSAVMFMVALLGDCFGGISNYLMGYFIEYIQHNISNKRVSTKLQSLIVQVNKRLFVSAFFSFVPLFGVLFTTFSGFFKVRVTKFLLVLIIGRLAYYAFLSWH